MKRSLFAIACLVLIGGFLLAAHQVRQQRSEALGFLAQEQAETFVRPHAPRYGPADAKVYLVEFTDPACETCAAFGPILKQLMAAHSDKIQLVIRYAPFHEGATDVVRLLEAARLQGMYWETLDLVYRTQAAWTEHHRVKADSLWLILAQQSDLDMELLSQDIENPAIQDIIEQDLADAQTLGVRRTPGIFVNGRPLEPFSVDRLQQLIEEEVAAAY